MTWSSRPSFSSILWRVAKKKKKKTAITQKKNNPVVYKSPTTSQTISPSSFPKALAVIVLLNSKIGFLFSADFGFNFSLLNLVFEREW